MDDPYSGSAADRGDSPAAPRLSAREMIDEAAHRLGGVDRLVAWAVKDDSDNESAFWKMLFPRLLSHQETEEARSSPEAEAWLGRALKS